MDVFYQLGELFLEALPTVVVVFLFYVFLKTQFFRPLERVLAERTARTDGARREAESLQAAVQEKNRAYQDALKAARSEIYAEQDAARRTALEERNARIRAARSQATEQIRAAKERIAAEVAGAHTELEKLSPALAGEITRAILERRPPQSQAGSEAR